MGGVGLGGRVKLRPQDERNSPVWQLGRREEKESVRRFGKQTNTLRSAWCLVSRVFTMKLEEQRTETCTVFVFCQ